jgi:hypothetical protein
MTLPGFMIPFGSIACLMARISASSAGLRDGSGLLANATFAVELAVDGAPVASVPAPAAPGLQSFALDVRALGLDPRFPHVLTVSATAPAGLTRWPLAFDAVDADRGAPLAAPQPAVGTAWVWLPETQAQAGRQ